MGATVWNPYPAAITTQTGEIAAAAKAMFYSAGTSGPITTYADSGLTTPNAFPVVANASGVFAPIYLPYGDYRVRVLDANNVLIFEADGISNPSPSSGGGGGGGSVPDDERFKTGDTKWRFDAAPIDGFVRLNGRTIGSSISGATERQNNDCADLFSYLWNTLPDSIAPVSTGRGASASADWAANKTIVLPSMQGRPPVGADTMGANAANLIQVSTTADVTSGSANITVASAAGLARLMNVIINGVACGTIIAISGTTVTLSTVYSGSNANGLALRASFFQDAQAPGSVGGSQTITQTKAEMPAHDHDWHDPQHDHDIAFATLYSSGATAGSVNGSAGTGAKTSKSSTGITHNSAGQGLPTQLVQPGMIGTFYIKL